MLQSISAQIVKSEVTGQLAADDALLNETLCVFLNHCGYDRLSCGGVLAEHNCAEVFVIRECDTQYKSRWLSF